MEYLFYELRMSAMTYALLMVFAITITVLTQFYLRIIADIANELLGTRQLAPLEDNVVPVLNRLTKYVLASTSGAITLISMFVIAVFAESGDVLIMAEYTMDGMISFTPMGVITLLISGLLIYQVLVSFLRVDDES